MVKTVFVVHRIKKSEADNVFIDILHSLSPIMNVTYTSNKHRIDIGDRVRILFCSGELYEMAGVRCNFYDANIPGADSMLSRGGAIKLDIFEFVNTLVKIDKAPE